MEYHEDRFEDHSLVVFDEGQLAALFPASVRDGIVISHEGLTFGGILTEKQVYAKTAIRYVSAILRYCHESGIGRLLFKQSPAFYQVVSQDETDYAFFLAGAKLYRMDIAFAIDQRLAEKIPYQERRRRAVKKALKNGVVVRETTDFAPFWNNILIPNLLLRFNVKPVHSLDEINLLAKANPGAIRQFEAWQGDRLMAGCTVFESSLVAHAQYISASDEGRQNGAIDLLFDRLIQDYFRDKDFFDFGIANEEQGRILNTGLMDWKEGFGARAYAHRFYELNTADFNLIDRALGVTKNTQDKV
jgi:hypothetical protein